MKILTSCFILVTAVSAIAQPPDTLWTRIIGGLGSDKAAEVHQTMDDGFIVAGYSAYLGPYHYNAYLLKLDADGNTEWERVYGYEDCRFSSVWQTTDGGYIAVGKIEPSYEVFLEVYMVKTNAEGDTLWTRTIGGPGWQEASHVRQTTDGGYVVVGKNYLDSEEVWQVYLLRIDENGNPLWTRMYGGEMSAYGNCVEQIQDGGCVIAGSVRRAPYLHDDIYVIMTDSCGDTLWTRILGGVSGDYGYTVQQTSDGGYIVGGNTSSFIGGLIDYYVIKMDSLGDTEWARTYGGYNNDYGVCIRQTASGGYVMAGGSMSGPWANHDFNVLKIDNNGDSVWTWNGGGNNSDWANWVEQTNNGGYIAAGHINASGAHSNIYVVRFAADEPGRINPERQPVNPKTHVLHLPYPNPFNPTTTISYNVPAISAVRVEVYNVLGLKVATLVNGAVRAGRHEVVWDAWRSPSGIYFCLMEAGDFHQVRKMILLK